MTHLLVDYDGTVARWVSGQLGIADFGPCVAIGIIQDDELIAGSVFTSYREASIEISFASTTPRWCTRSTLRGAVFWYPFEQLGCHRLTAMTRSKATSVRKFLRHLGFTEEGVMRRALLDGDDVVIHGILREECRWL